MFKVNTTVHPLAILRRCCRTETHRFPAGTMPSRRQTDGPSPGGLPCPASRPLRFEIGDRAGFGSGRNLEVGDPAGRYFALAEQGRGRGVEDQLRGRPTTTRCASRSSSGARACRRCGAAATCLSVRPTFRSSSNRTAKRQSGIRPRGCSRLPRRPRKPPSESPRPESSQPFRPAPS